MKVLFDHNVPAYLLAQLPGATSAYGAGWHELSNGALISVAVEAGFELLVTLDKGFRWQRNVESTPISIAILEPAGQSRAGMIAAAEALAAALDQIEPGSILTFRSS